MAWKKIGTFVKKLHGILQPKFLKNDMVAIPQIENRGTNVAKISAENKHIHDFLQYYEKMKVAPEYAVLIKGPWGTGKTWLVDESLKLNGTDAPKILNVSLYGITDFEGIEDEFFRQLHPILSSKGMAIAGKVGKGLLKATLKIDLGAHESTSLSIPEIELPDYLKRTAGCILVFDDIERCSINICDLLGYINHFVEKNGYKVILIANEDEIIQNDELDNTKRISYMRIKEKLIGKEFEVTPDLGSAVNAFLDIVDSEFAKKAFRENEELIRDLFENSEYRNLRNLRQSLQDLGRLLEAMPTYALTKKEVVSHILKIFLIYSFEIKSGKIRSDEIDKIDSGIIMRIAFDEQTSDEEQPERTIISKYRKFDVHETLLAPSAWKDLFSKGIIDVPGIEESLKNSKYFYTDRTPNWVKLWHYFELEDDEFERLFAIVNREFVEMNFDEITAVKHVVGTFLVLSENGLISQKKDEIIILGKKIIEKLRELNKLPLPSGYIGRFRDETGSAGLGYHAVNFPEFKEFSDYISEQSALGVPANNQKEANELLDLMASDTELFFRRLILNNHSDNRFYDSPILTYITPADFVKCFLKISSPQKRLVCYTLDVRYEPPGFNMKLTSEADWLKRVIDFLEDECKKRAGKLSGHTIRSAIDDSLAKGYKILEGTKLSISGGDHA